MKCVCVFLCLNHRAHFSVLMKNSLWLSSATRNLIFHENVSFSELLPWLVCRVSRGTFCTQKIIPHDLERTCRAELNELGVIVEGSCAFIPKDFLDLSFCFREKKVTFFSLFYIIKKNIMKDARLLENS